VSELTQMMGICFIHFNVSFTVCLVGLTLQNWMERLVFFFALLDIFSLHIPWYQSVIIII